MGPSPPDPVPAVLPDAGDIVGGQAESRVIGRNMLISTFLPRPDAVAVRADPETAPGIFVQGMDESASEFRTGLEAVLCPVIAVQSRRRSQQDVTGTGAGDAGGGQVGKIILLDLPGGKIHPEAIIYIADIPELKVR